MSSLLAKKCVHPNCAIKKKQPIENFTVNTYKDGTKVPHSRCKRCRTRYGKRYSRDRDERRAYNYYRAGLGPTIKESYYAYQKMHKDQQGARAICARPETKRFKSNNKLLNLSLDHCHKTNKIRQLLCGNCNSLLGYAQDSTDRLLKAYFYLKKHSK